MIRQYVISSQFPQCNAKSCFTLQICEEDWGWEKGGQVVFPPSFSLLPRYVPSVASVIQMCRVMLVFFTIASVQISYDFLQLLKGVYFSSVTIHKHTSQWEIIYDILYSHSCQYNSIQSNLSLKDCSRDQNVVS